MRPPAGGQASRHNFYFAWQIKIMPRGKINFMLPEALPAGMGVCCPGVARGVPTPRARLRQDTSTLNSLNPYHTLNRGACTSSAGCSREHVPAPPRAPTTCWTALHLQDDRCRSAAGSSREHVPAPPRAPTTAVHLQDAPRAPTTAEEGTPPPPGAAGSPGTCAREARGWCCNREGVSQPARS
jgi:hypothetical protein